MKNDNANVESDALAEMPEWTEDDWARAKPNRFADRFDDVVTVVTLDKDTSEVFRTSEEVNEALRSLIRKAAKPPHPRDPAHKG